MGSKNQRRIIPGNAQYIGSRAEQEDSFSFSDIDDECLVEKIGVIAVLADGMGGMSNGKDASNIAVKTMIEEYTNKSKNESTIDALLRSINKSNYEVLRLSKELSLKDQMGTTLVAVVIHEDNLYYVSAGDSHIYLFRRNRLICLNREHIYARHLAEEAALGKTVIEQVKVHPERKHLTSYLGLDELKEIDFDNYPISLKSGDRIILCSDGFYNCFDERQVIEAMQYDPQTACDFLINKVISKKAEHQDNATVSMILYE